MLGSTDAPLHFPDLKFGAGGGDDHVSGHRQGKACPQDIAMDRRNDGLPVDRLPDPEQTSRWPDASWQATQALQFIHRAELTLPDVGPRAKGASRSRDDEDMQIVVLVESAVCLQQFIAHSVIVRVEHARPIQRNIRNPLLVSYKMVS